MDKKKSRIKKQKTNHVQNNTSSSNVTLKDTSNGFCFCEMLQELSTQQFKELQKDFLETDKTGLKWSLETFKQFINKKDEDEALLLLQNLCLSGDTKTTINTHYKSILSGIRFIMSNSKELKDEKFSQMCKIFCSCLLYGFHSSMDVENLNASFILLFHATKHGYNTKDLKTYSTLSHYFVYTYLSLLSAKIKITDESQKLVTLSMQMSYALYTRYFPLYVKSSTSQTDKMTDLFVVRIQELLLRLFNDYSKFIDDFNIFTSRWTQVILQKYKLDPNRCIDILKMLIQSFMWLKKSKNSSISSKEDFRVFQKLLIFYVHVFSLKHSMDIICFKWLRESSTNNFEHLNEYLLFIENIIKDILTVKKQCSSKKCSDMEKPINTNIITLNDSPFLIDCLILYKNMYGTSKCIEPLQYLLTYSSKITSMLITTDKQIEHLSSESQKKLISFIGWSLELFYKTVGQLEENKCRLSRDILFGEYDEYLRQISNLNVMRFCSQMFNEVKMIGSLLSNISVHLFNIKRLESSKLGFVTAVEIYKSLISSGQQEFPDKLILETIDKHSLLIRCAMKMENFEDALQVIVQLFTIVKENFDHLSSVIVDNVEVLQKLETHVNTFTKIRSKHFSSRKVTLFEELFGANKSHCEETKWLCMTLSKLEYNALKKDSHKTSPKVLQNLLEVRSQIFMEEGDMLNYALVMVETATLHGVDYSERATSCAESIHVLEGMLQELQDSGDLFEWHVRDVLASAYFQLSLVQYETKISNNSNTDSQKSLKEIVDELSISSEKESVNLKEFSFDWYLEHDYTSSIATALDYWIEIAIESNKKGDCTPFYHAAKTAQFLYEASIFYSLMCQNINAFKCAYLSGYIYSVSSKNIDDDDGDDDCGYNEEATTSIVHCLQQLLRIENKTCAEKILHWLQSFAVNKSFKIQVDLVTAAYYTKAGEFERSKDILGELLQSEKLNSQTKSSLTLKSEIYLQCSYLKLIKATTHDMKEFVASDAHQPIKSPLPPISDCVHLLRSVYASSNNDYCDGSVDNNTGPHFSSSWHVLDKLLNSLTQYATILLQQGSVLEAKAHLREGLILSKKFQLSFWVVSILQQLASIELILQDEVSFNKIFNSISIILQSVDHCFDNGTIHLPEFVNHVQGCSCLFCVTPKLQQMHITLYLQYIGSLKRFKKCQSNETIEMEIIDALIENAKNRFENSCDDISDIVDRFENVLMLNKDSDCSTLILQKKVTKSKNNKKNKIMKKERIYTASFESPFSLFHAEAKIIQPYSRNDRMIETVEHVIIKLEELAAGKVAKHDYGRLLAQLYCLRSLLYCGKNIIDTLVSSKPTEKGLGKQVKEENISKPTRRVKKTTRNVTKTTRNVTKTTRNVTKTKGKTSRRTKQLDENSEENFNECDIEKVRGTDTNVSNDDTNSNIETVARSRNKYSIKDNTKAINVEVLTKDLEHALFLLNPYTDTLIIKSIYQLITFISDISNKHVSVACQFLHSARILHQQLLLLYAKQLRKSKDISRRNNQISVSSENNKQLERTSLIIDEYSEPEYIFQTEKLQSLVDLHLPQGWRVCSVSLSEINSQRYLILARMQANETSLLLRIPIDDDQSEAASGNVCNLASMFDEDILQKFDDLMQENKDSMQIADKQEWWNERKRLNHQLEAYLSRVERSYLQGWKSFLCGDLLDKETKKIVEDISNEICESLKLSHGLQIDDSLLKVLIESFFDLKREQLLKCFVHIVNDGEVDSLCQIFEEVMVNYESVLKKKLKICKRDHVVLVLDKQLQKLPWENLPCLRTQSVCRMPSLLMTVTHCMNHKDLLKKGMSVEDTFYVLNPRNDLKNTQDKFIQFFQTEKWMGVTGRAPSQTEFVDALTKHDLFVYCGHGSGQEYLSWDAVQKLQCKALALLMGCSSGKLNTQGEIEAYGMVQHYLSAGSPSVVANLWDVTDRDIDMFLESLLKNWYTKKGKSITDAVTMSRNSCKLPYMIGAAPVVYGLPITLR